jgi:hypothetical protein
VNQASVFEFIKSGGGDKSDRWSIPFWTSGLGAGILPIGAMVDNIFIPIGTAFIFSKLGFVASALHNVTEAAGYDRAGKRLRTGREYPSEFRLQDVGLSVLHSVVTSRNGGRLTLWPLETADAAPPTDLVFGFPKAHPKIGKLVLPLSFAVPRVGSMVHCVGFGGMTYPSGGIPVPAIQSGEFDWSQTSFDLKVTTGRVKKILLQGVAPSYPTGPCFIMDNDVEHGQSGGPVFNEDGHVCGVVSASVSSFLSHPATAVSMLYPALFANLKFGINVGSGRINAEYPLIERIAHGDVVTDDSETLLGITYDEDGVPVVGPRIHRDDHIHVFDDLTSALELRSATRASGPIHRVKWNKREDES